MKDFVLYAAIAIAFVGAAGAYGIHQAHAGGSPRLPLKWIGFSGATAIVFGYLIRQNTNLWPMTRFWFVLSGLVAAHVAVGLIVLRQIEAVPLLVLAPLCAIEFAAISVALSVLVPDQSH